MTPTLTIAIPTRDRNELLRDHVAALLPQLTPAVRLVVFDNASAMPVSKSLVELLESHQGAQVRVIRNPVNIGSSANVMRCLETCETPWIWILGDDDRPLANAVTLALESIARLPDCLAINFASMHSNSPTEFVTEGLEDYLRRQPNFANSTLISNNIFRADRLTKHALTGYFFAPTLYPHMACLLTELNLAGGQCCFTPERLVEWGPVSKWSRVMAGVGMGTFLDLPIPHRTRRLLAQRLLTVAGRYSSLAVLLLDQVGDTIDAPTARYLHEQAYQRLYRYERGMSASFYRWTCKIMFCAPGLSARLYRGYRNLRSDPRPESRQNDMARM